MKKSIEFDCYDSFTEASAAARERFSKHFTEDEINDMEELSEVITNFVQGSKKEVILIIDEVDKSSNNQLFYLVLFQCAKTDI